MKASSPPPPPPGSGPDPSSEPAAVPSPDAAPAAVSPPKLATWPEWFASADGLLAVLAVVTAFLATSYAARNADVWLHLAGGRNLAQGHVRPGVDPFSFSGADRAWVHTSWLFDVALYAAYSVVPDGAAAVGAKAVAVAAAFGLLLLLRRPGQSLWPWAVLIVVGVLAAAPFAQVRPVVASMLFLAGTFVLLSRRPWAAAGWRDPLTLAGLVWVWANCDGWAILGPVVVAVVLVGELLNRFLPRADATAGADPFPPAPPVPALAKALGLGLAAVLLNPMFLGALAKDAGEAVAQLVPNDLGFGIPAAAADDVELSALLRSPLSEVYQTQTNLGKNLNGGAFAALLVGGAVVLVAGYARLRAAHVLLWVLFAGLALWHVRLIPFFAVAAVPLAAGHLNGLSARARLGTWAQPGTRVLVTASGMGRVLSVIAVVLVAAATYPGWTMPPQADPANNNPLEWTVRPDPGSVRAATLLDGWRAAGRVPADVRGLAAGPDFGNYCLWFAPREKVFVDGRYTFHRRELPDLLAVREQVGARRGGRDDVPDAGEVRRVCEAYGAGYLVLCSATRRVDEAALFTLLGDGDGTRWVPWHVDGRAAVLGRVSDRPSAALSARLRFDPVRLAFGPDQTPVPDGGVAPPPVPGTIVDEYTDRPKPAGPDADDAILWADYDRIVGFRADQALQRAGQEWARAAARDRDVRGAVAGGTIGDATAPPRRLFGDDELALPVLAVRAARRAVAATPDRPEPYLALAAAYRLPLVPVADVPIPFVGVPEQQLQLMTAQVRFLDRLPDPCPRPLAGQAFREALALAEAYGKTGQFDLRLGAVEQVVKFAAAVQADDVRQVMQLGPADDPLKILQESLGQLARQVQQQVDVARRQPTVAARFRYAQERGLPGLAIKLFAEAAPGDFGTDQADVGLSMIVLELRAGRLERAAADLAALDGELGGAAAGGRGGQLIVAVRGLQFVQRRLQGNFTALTDEYNRTGPARLDPSVARTAEHLDEIVEGLAAVAGPVASFAGGQPTRPNARPAAFPVDQFSQARQILTAEALYQYDRAILGLISGDTAEARRRFQLARRPQGADLARFGPADLLQRTDRFLALIDRAAAPAQ